MTRYDDYYDTIPTDHAPLEGEPRKPIYGQRRESDSSGPRARLIAAILLVAICAVIVMVAVPVAR